MGKGAAVRKGMLLAQGEFCIYTDADIPYQFECIEQFLYYLDSREFDIVIGDRTLPQSSYYGSIPWVRRVGSHFISFIVRCFIIGGISDSQCGLKGFRKNAAKDIFSLTRINDFGFDIEVLYIALKRNYDLKCLPVVLRCNEASSVNVLRDGLKVIGDLFAIKYHHVLGHYKQKNTY